MTSLLTNTAAQTALASLTLTNKNLSATQNHISTGYRVASAADNAAYWSIATTMRSDSSALSTVSDALGLGSATVDVAYTGVDQAIKVVTEIKKKLVAAREPGVDRNKVQTDITALQNQLSGIGDAAVFSGENWLSVDSSDANYNATKYVVSSFSRSGTTVNIGTISVDTSTIKLYDANDQSGILDALRDSATGAIGGDASFSIATLNIAALSDSAGDLTTLEGYIQGADVAIGSMTDAATTLGAVKSRIALQENFVTALKNAIDRGVSTLVDADMNDESTRLQALQVQAQLGIQALSIANTTSQNILSLFR